MSDKSTVWLGQTSNR